MPRPPAFVLPRHRVEPYEEVEIRIQAAVSSIQATPDEHINVAKIARTYEIPVARL